MPIESVNPATGKLIRSFDALTEDAIEVKLALAASVAATYPQEPVAQQRVLDAAAGGAAGTVTAKTSPPLMTSEMGTTLVSARAEVDKCAITCRYYADNGARMLAEETVRQRSTPRSYVRREPLGVVLAIMPWNFPLWQVFRFLAPALMAGNVGVLKTCTPRTCHNARLAIEALVRRAGPSRGVFLRRCWLRSARWRSADCRRARCGNHPDRL